MRIDEQNETDTKKETPIISVHAVVADREFDDAGHVYMWVIPFGMGDEIFVDESKKIKAMYRLTVKDEAVKSRLESLDMASTSEVPGYSEALTKYKAWIAAGRMGTLHETWAKSSRSDVINYFTVALEENIPGFRKARLDDDVPLMANLYRRYVIGYQIQDGNRIGGQKGFLYYKCGLGSLSGTSRPFFENTDGNPGSLLRLAGEKRELLKGIVSKEGLKSWEFEEKPANLQEDDGLDYEAAKSYYSNWQRSVRRFNFPNGFWYLEKTIANFVLVVLDNNIPGFKDARDRGDIKLMAALYRRYVIWYKAENPQKYPDRQVAFFNEKGGLQRLVATHRLLSKGNMPWALMRWLTKKGGVLYGLMDEHNEEALNPLEIDPNQEEIPSDGLSYDVMKQHYEIWRDKVGKLGFSDMFWRKSKTAANAVAIVLDENILGFRDAREHDNVALMDALFLEGPVRIGLRKFFYDNGLSGLLERPPTYLNRPVTAGSLLRLAGSFGLLGHFLTDRQRLTPEELDFAVSPPIKVTGPAASHTGGIDLTSGKTLLVQNSGLSLHFHIDPAMLKHLHDSLGFTPRIITIQPMNDLRDFLGL